MTHPLYAGTAADMTTLQMDGICADAFLEENRARFWPNICVRPARGPNGRSRFAMISSTRAGHCRG